MVLAGQALREEKGYAICVLDFSGNFLVIEILNSVSQGIGVVAAAIFAIYLFQDDKSRSVFSKVALGIYATSLTIMFLNSTLYHSLFYCISTHFVFQALDHTGIYLLIAGS